MADPSQRATVPRIIALNGLKAVQLLCGLGVASFCCKRLNFYRSTRNRPGIPHIALGHRDLIGITELTDEQHPQDAEYGLLKDDMIVRHSPVSACEQHLKEIHAENTGLFQPERDVRLAPDKTGFQLWDYTLLELLDQADRGLPLPTWVNGDFVLQTALTLARGLEYLHNSGWAHSQVCPRALVLDGAGTRGARLAGLGMAEPLTMAKAEEDNRAMEAVFVTLAGLANRCGAAEVGRLLNPHQQPRNGHCDKEPAICNALAVNEYQI
eukprot:TRINITY_DN2709_c0_g1_i1.p1 TRINITY_DN2709_c0_g1~~TRINITY_DN2709_c0_g1_i1.p1  ORF type:complete len:267 (-),score=16.44 TRINITY_DN2709_c0_g1_i1:240-1040(-)